MTRYNQFIKVSLIAVLFISFVSCNRGSKPETESAEVEILPEDIVELRDDQIKLANIETGPMDSLSLSGRLKVNGIVTVAPQNLATVCMPLGGFVKSTNLIPGNSVVRGQTLAILENQEFVDIQQNYLDAKIKLEYAEIEYIRHSDLYIDEVYSQNNMQEIETNYKSLKAQVNALGQKLLLIGINPLNLNENTINSSIAVVSPISGYVQTVNINIGKFVVSSDILFEIVNSDKLLLELTLFEKDANKVLIGQKIRFFINNETEQHEAVIYQTGKSIDTDKTLKVFANVPGSCKNVLPGMYVNAIIEASTNMVPALPSDAIVSFDDKDYIFVFEKDKEEGGKPFTEYRMVEVRKGVSDSGFTEVIVPAGFNISTAKVVIKGAYNLLSAKKNAGEMSC